MSDKRHFCSLGLTYGLEAISKFLAEKQIIESDEYGSKIKMKLDMSKIC